MERDVIVSHGAAKFMHEKYFAHSDAYDEYVCTRCKKTAIVNVQKNIYKCNYCGDNAVIAKFPTSWSSKLFIQELETMNVGIRRYAEPHTYFVADEKLEETLTKSMYPNY